MLEPIHLLRPGMVHLHILNRPRLVLRAVSDSIRHAPAVAAEDTHWCCMLIELEFAGLCRVDLQILHLRRSGSDSGKRSYM